PNVSLVDLVVEVENDVTAASVNKAFEEAAKNDLKGVLEINKEPLVSIDYTTSESSAIVDGLSTMAMGEKKIKVLAWYDNEWGYSKRIVDLTEFVGKSIS